MIELHPELTSLAPTCRILPRIEDWPAVHITLSDLELHPSLVSAAEPLAHGDTEAAWQALRAEVQTSPLAALVGGGIGLQAGDTSGAIDALEASLSAAVIEVPPVNGAVVLSFTDEGMIVFDLNSLAGVGLLVYAYARAGRREDAVELAEAAHRVIGAEGFLALELVLLRDAKRWDDLLAAAERADPSDIGRFEIQLLQAQALEEVGRRADADLIYSKMAQIEVDESEVGLTWLRTVQRRCKAIEAGLGSDELDAGDLADTPTAYDPLNSRVAAPLSAGGPTPTSPSPVPEEATWVRAGLSLGGTSMGS